MPKTVLKTKTVKPVKVYADNYMNQVIGRVGKPFGSEKVTLCTKCKKKAVKKAVKKKKKKVLNVDEEILI